MADLFDLVIIGAGVHGLAMAKTYLEVNPRDRVQLLDSQASIGGVWAKERLYPGLKTNNMIGTYEFSDYPMVPEKWGLKKGDFIPGEVCHGYLDSFAKRYNIKDRCRLNCKVESAQMNDDESWTLQVSESGMTSQIQTLRLVLANGLTSDPKMPKIEGMESFQGSMFHARELADRAEELKAASDIVIVGGSKSAYDSINLCCNKIASPARIHMVLRESGHGTNWISPPYVTPAKQWLEKLLTTRFLTWFSPCYWAWADGYTWPHWFLQQTWLGQKIASGFWWVLNDDVTTLTGYDKHPETKKLKPKNSAYWIAGALSILNYDVDVFEYIRSGRVKLCVSDISHITKDTIDLKDGTSIRADTIICCTGWQWQPSIKFSPPLPTITNSTIESEKSAILSELPLLSHRPIHQVATDLKALSTSPLSLYRFMLPTSPTTLPLHSLAFIGHHLTVQTFLIAQAQALWLTSYFSHPLTNLPQIPSPSALTTSVSKDMTYLTLRHPPEAGGYGDKFADMAFESLNYVDLLLRDLGMEYARKKAGLWGWLGVRDVFEPYDQQDYRGLVEEWMALRGGK